MTRALSPPERAAILESFKQGYGIKATARRLGHSDNTVRRYYPNEAPPPCPCGRPLVHTGFCEFRLKGGAAQLSNPKGEDKMNEPMPAHVAMTVCNTALNLRLLGDAMEELAQRRIELLRTTALVESILSHFAPDAQGTLRALVMSDAPGITPMPEMPAGGGLTPVAPVETPIPPDAPEPASEPVVPEPVDRPQQAEPAPEASTDPEQVPRLTGIGVSSDDRDVYILVRDYAEQRQLAQVVIGEAKRLGRIPDTAFYGVPPHVMINRAVADRHLVRNEEGVPLGFAGNPRLPTHSEKRTIEEAERLYQQTRSISHQERGASTLKQRLLGRTGSVVAVAS